MAFDEDEDWPAFVIDNGSGSIKYGPCGADEPASIISNAVGRYSEKSRDSRKRETFIGSAMQRKRELLNLSYPINHGIVTDWEDMEKIWHYVFEDDLRVDTAQHPVLMTEPPRNPMYNREKMAQIMFETFQVPAFYVANPALLSLYSNGRVNGFVVETGAGVTQTLAVYEGYCIKAATHRTGLAGREMTHHLMRLLNKRGYSFSTSAERELVREMKESCCYVAEDFESETARSQVRTERYRLPDGQEITLGPELFQCMEAMFNPALLDTADTKLNYRSGIADIAYCGLQRCHADTREVLCKNVIVTGGNAMHRGFCERFKRELTARGVPPVSLNVIFPPERRKSVWIGGSILASLSNYKGMWISKASYEEYGPNVVYKDGFMLFDPEQEHH